MKPRRQRVMLRPKARSRRLKQRFAALALLVLGLVAAATVRHLGEGASPLDAARERWLGSGVEIELSGELPPPLRAAAEAFLASPEAASLSPSAKAAALQRRLPALAQLRARRDWTRRRAVLIAKLRRAVAAAPPKGPRRPAYLSDDGELFEAPEGLFAIARPLVEPGAAPKAELAALAKALGAMSAPEALPSALERMRWISARDGWEAKLSDGTTVLWGDLRWTRQKGARLREILADARGQLGPERALSADMRYFEDGKVLLRPAGAGVAVRK